MRFARRGVLALFVLALPISALAVGHDPTCDKQNIDASKLSRDDKAALLEKCTAQLRAEDCGIGGVDLSMMSAADQKAMKEGCVDKMKAMGCDLKRVDLSKISVAETQKMMDQCHDKLFGAPATPAPKSPAAAPAPKAG